jgi:excisionase family DNA binding protein
MLTESSAPAPAEQAKVAPEPLYLTVGQASALVQLSVKTLYRIIASDQTFPALRLTPGGAVRIHRGQLERWLEARTQGRGRRAGAAAKLTCA